MTIYFAIGFRVFRLLFFLNYSVSWYGS